MLVAIALNSLYCAEGLADGEQMQQPLILSPVPITHSFLVEVG